MNQQKPKESYDICIVGGGIVGLSTAWQLQQTYPDKKIVLIEKEAEFGLHQTGHNSGVIHAGVYYQPGSLKAKFCKEGAVATKAFCAKYKIDFDECGKLLIATNTLELTRLKALETRCYDNKIPIQWLDQNELKQQEPNVKGLAAILVRETGIVNYQQICEKLAQLFTQLGGTVLTSSEVISLQESSYEVAVGIKGESGNTRLSSRFLVACTGLMADRTSKMLNIKTDFQIIPFRGEYYRLNEKHNQIVNHLIYPVPDPDLPFLGVHLTRMIDGSVTVGPNAVQGWKREGYGKLNFSIKDTLQMVLFIGFWRLLAKHWQTGMKETRNSWFKQGYLKEVQKYCGQIKVQDLEAYPAGIRAQAVMKDGSLVHDFLFVQSKRSLHVCNAPSPAATSAFPIGKYIIGKLDEIMTDINVEG